MDYEVVGWHPNAIVGQRNYLFLDFYFVVLWVLDTPHLSAITAGREGDKSNRLTHDVGEDGDDGTACGT